MLNKKIEDITNRIILRSELKRKLYLSQMLSQFNKEFSRAHLNWHRYQDNGPLRTNTLIPP